MTVSVSIFSSYKKKNVTKNQLNIYICRKRIQRSTLTTMRNPWPTSEKTAERIGLL